MSQLTRPLRRTETLLALTALIATTLVVAVPAATAAPTCFGMSPTIEAVAGAVTVGTAGDDVIVGTPGPDVIVGNGGNDRICSGGGADDVDGGPGDDLIKLGKGSDVAAGGAGDDLIVGNGGGDRIFGNAGHDRLSGGGGSDRIVGGKGRDTISGNAGHDVLRGNSARDRIVGGKGDDLLEGGAAGDALLGNAGRDTLRGQAGTDACVGGAGRDSLSSCEERSVPSPTPTPSATPTPAPESDPTPAATATPTATPVGTATPTPTPTPDPVAIMSAFIDTSVVDAYGGSYPWLVTAWDYLQSEGTTQIADLSPGLAGTVSVSCGWSSVALGWCGNTTLTMDVAHTTNVDVIIHELAHVLETPTGVLADPGPLGMAQMYFNIEWGGACDASEIFADTLLHLTKPDAYLAYYSFACPSLPSEPTADAEAVVASVLAGTDPDWFASTYADGTEAWAAVMTLQTVDRLRVVTNLADEFGGYCSIPNTMNTAFFGGSDPNPWSDDGC